MSVECADHEDKLLSVTARGALFYWVLVFLVTIMHARQVEAGTVNKQDAFCAEQWRAMSAEFGDDWAPLRKAWMQLEQKCRGTGNYEYRLATIEEGLGNRDASIRVLESAIRKKLPYQDVLYSALVSTRFSKAITADPPDLASARKYSADLEKFATSKPDFFPAWQELANEKQFLKDYAGSVAAARRAIAIESNSWLARRALVMSLGKQDQYEAARIEIAPAIKSNRQLLEDIDFMLVTAFVFLKLDEFDAAENVLATFRDRNAQLKDHPAVVRMAQIIADVKKARMKPGTP
jgi:tetratricopeptide (TPR) repeat protein